MSEIIDDDIEEIKNKLCRYKIEQIEFNEPHFTQQMELREGNKEEIIKNILKPNKLVFIPRKRKIW